MSRKLVVCLDGTSNRFCKDNTNVIKLLAMLDKGAADQQIYYQPGIGTMAPPGLYGRLRLWLSTRFDLAFAILLKYHVQDAYRFLMRYYEDGDQIFIFGFSRGAYTARVLAGMLYKVGLVAKGNEELVQFAWAMYAEGGNDDLARAFRNTFGKKVQVDFLGVWDTVSSVRWAGKAVHLPYSRENPIVRTIRHAISLDERRAYFRQNLWTANPPQQQDVLQVWFPGVHCDVGGGYLERDSGLSKVSLRWMVTHAESAGLLFHPGALNLMLPAVSTGEFAAPNATAGMHRSLHGLWWLVEFVPKRIKDVTKAFAARWIIPQGAPRWVGEGARIHVSVFDRMASVAGYNPRNIPATYEVDSGKGHDGC
jgi:uncharacterized protein (DUF2235 family)